MINSFNDLGISEPILKAIEEMGFETPTEVQQRAIPLVLRQEDLIVKSKTGSGKTAVFGVSMLQLIGSDAEGPQALVLTPTRELAVQIDSDIKRMSKHLPHRTTAVYGQHNMSLEVQDLKKKPSIVTGTPGRVYDHIEHGNLKTGHIRFLVLDEADRMLDMGFYDQVVRIVETLPKNRVTLLFSATIPPEIHTICRKYMKHPVTIEIESSTKTVDTIQQVYYRMEKNEKRSQLNRLLLLERPKSCMIFCNTRMAVDQVHRFLSGKGYAAGALHGDIPQGKRLKTMQQFKQGAFNLLVATDVAARGIHIDDLSLVVNYDVPIEKDGYVHRIGRTGRAGNGGRAITMVTSEDIMSLYEIEEHIGAMIEEAELPSKEVLDSNMTESEKWMQENMQKNTVYRADSEEDSKDIARKHPGGKRTHHEKHGDRIGKSVNDNKPVEKATDMHAGRKAAQADVHGKPVKKAVLPSYATAKPTRTTTGKPVQSTAKPTRTITDKPVQSTAKTVPIVEKQTAPGKKKHYINSAQPKQGNAAVQNKNPDTGKPLIKRVFQRLFGKQV